MSSGARRTTAPSARGSHATRREGLAPSTTRPPPPRRRPGPGQGRPSTQCASGGPRTHGPGRSLQAGVDPRNATQPGRETGRTLTTGSTPTAGGLGRQLRLGTSVPAKEGQTAAPPARTRTGLGITRYPCARTEALAADRRRPPRLPASQRRCPASGSPQTQAPDSPQPLLLQQADGPHTSLPLTRLRKQSFAAAQHSARPGEAGLTRGRSGRSLLSGPQPGKPRLSSGPAPVRGLCRGLGA